MEIRGCDVDLWDGWSLSLDWGLLGWSIRSTFNQWFHTGTHERMLGREYSHLVWHLCSKFIYFEILIHKDHKRVPFFETTYASEGE